MSTVLVDTTDLGEAEEVLSANYSSMRFGAASDRPTYTRAVRSTLGSMAFDELRYTYAFQYEGEPMDGIVLCRVKSGALVHQQPGYGASLCQPGTATAVAARQGLPFSGKVLTGEFQTVLIDRPLLDSVAATAPKSGTSESVKLTGVMPVSSAANAHLVSFLDHVTRDVVTNPHAAASPLISGVVARYLAATMLATFPNTAEFEPTIEDRHDTTPVLLRRAIAYIDDNAHIDISTADIARHIYVTPRALQLMFRKHRGCTPSEYLRTVRLHYAHLDLVRGNRLTTTVGQIAGRWGFSHLGRFGVYYRQQYGQSPHDTLRG